MATYFGEIVEKSSRAFWDDDYDSEDGMDGENVEKCERNLEVFYTSSTSRDVIKSKLFLVIHGPLSEGFAEACLTDKGECIAEIKETDKQDVDDKTFGKTIRKATTIHYLNNDIILCICSPNLDITQAFEFTEKISAWMKNAEQIIVLTCNYLSEYLVTRSLNEQDTFLRALKTNYYNCPVLCDLLEQPNTLKTIPAGIMTWCQMSKIPAVAYVCYARSFGIDSSSVKPFAELAQKLPFKLLKDKADFSYKTYSGPEIASNLYM